MTEKRQNTALKCARCNGRMDHHDRRPRSLRQRIQHRDSRLYVCPECGTKNLILHKPAHRHASDSAGAESSAVSRYHEVERRIARNRRAYVKLREMIESDRRLLKHLSNSSLSKN